MRNRVSLINKLKGVPPSESKIGMKSNHNWKNQTQFSDFVGGTRVNTRPASVEKVHPNQLNEGTSIGAPSMDGLSVS